MPESREDEQARVMKAGTEAERLLLHPLIAGFFEKEIEDVFNAFCTMRPGVGQEAYLRLHMEVHSLLNLKAKLSAYVAEKAAMMDRERYDKLYQESET